MPIKLVAFTEPNGVDQVFINPEHVVRVRPTIAGDIPGSSCIIDLSEGFQAVKETMTEVRVALGTWTKRGTRESPST